MTCWTESATRVFDGDFLLLGSEHDTAWCVKSGKFSWPASYSPLRKRPMNIAWGGKPVAIKERFLCTATKESDSHAATRF